MPSASLEVNRVSAVLDHLFPGSLPLFVSTLSICEDIFFFCTWKGFSHYSWVLWQRIMQPREHTNKSFWSPQCLWTSIELKAMWCWGGPDHIVLLYLQPINPSQARPFSVCFLLMRIMWLRGQVGAKCSQDSCLSYEHLLSAQVCALQARPSLGYQSFHLWCPYTKLLSVFNHLHLLICLITQISKWGKVSEGRYFSRICFAT